jgi:hypothetical protein
MDFVPIYGLFDYLSRNPLQYVLRRDTIEQEMEVDMREKYDRFVGFRISARELAILERRADELGGGLSVAFRAILAEWERNFALRAGSITDGSLSASMPDTPKGGNLESLQAGAPDRQRQAVNTLSRGMARDAASRQGEKEGAK